jgi:Fur family peroxide stress response transcriptional regulator
MDTQQIVKKLRSKGYKITPQRLAICKFILSSKNHPSAEQIYREVRKTYPTISLATVYLTLDLLRNLGFVEELGFSDQSSRYGPNSSPHINIVCPKCGKIYDYEAAKIKKLSSQIVEETGLTPLRQRLDLYALCDSCAQEAETEQEQKVIDAYDAFR